MAQCVRISEGGLPDLTDYFAGGDEVGNLNVRAPLRHTSRETLFPAKPADGSGAGARGSLHGWGGVGMAFDTLV